MLIRFFRALSDCAACALPVRCRCAACALLRAAACSDVTALMVLYRANTVKQEMRPSRSDGLLLVLLVAAQVGPGRASYACTSDADCQYQGCFDNSCACPSSSSDQCVNGFWTGYPECNNGAWDAFCVSTTYKYHKAS